MNPMDWLKSVREGGQKSPIPPVPPEAFPGENSEKPLVPPVAPCSSVYLNGKRDVCNGSGPVEVQPEIWWGEERDATSGCDRGKPGVCEETGDLGYRGDRGNQGKVSVSNDAALPKRRREPFLTAGGDLTIPFDSDPKYHWWNGGQSVKQTLAEVRAKLEAERRQVPTTAGGQEFGESSVNAGGGSPGVGQECTGLADRGLASEL